MANSRVQMETSTQGSGVTVSGKEQDMLLLTGTRPMTMTNQSQFAMMANGRRTRHMGKSIVCEVAATLKPYNSAESFPDRFFGHSLA